MSQMTRLRESGIKVIIVAGNHDAASQITKTLRVPDNVKMLSVQKPESFIIEDAGAVIHGQGFASRVVTDNLAGSYPKASPGLFNIGLLHTCLDGREGHEPYAPCSINELISHGYDYCALGHVHTRETVHQSPWVVFPGNIQGRNARETGAKGCMLVTVEDGAVIEVEFKSLDVFRWSVLDLDITDITEINDIFERADKVLQREVQATSMPAALRIRLCGLSRLHGKILSREEYVKNGIRGCAVDSGNGNLWVEKVSIDTSVMSDPEALMAQSGALGGLLRSIHDLQYDEKSLREIFGELGDLFHRLPHEYQNDAEAVYPDRKETMVRAMEDVRHMLLNRILSSGGDR